MKGLGLICLLAVSPAVASPCLMPDGGTSLTAATEGAFAAALRFSPAPPKVGVPFAVELRLCGANSASVERLAVDAQMPAHRHGMNYQPVIADKGDGVYEARGFLFHMPGRWDIMLTVTAAGKPQLFRLGLDIR
jgi:hypothetical protein